MRLAFVVLISATVNACGIAYYMGGLGEMGSALHVGSWAFITLLGTSLTTLLLYFFYYLFAAPKRIYEDNQKEIAELKRPLNLYVNIPLVSLISTKDFPPLPHCGGRGQLIKLEDLILTNRSNTSRVSLSLTLCVRVDKFLAYRKDTENPEYLRVQSYKESYEGASLWEFLPNLINIAPEETIRGSMCFLISSEVHKELGFNLLPNHYSCVLEIFDYVSGEMMAQNIDQKFIESPKAQLVKLEIE